MQTAIYSLGLPSMPGIPGEISSLLGAPGPLTKITTGVNAETASRKGPA